MLMAYSGPPGELSCIIGNLFIELEAPCAACGEEPQGIKLCGTTYSGEKALLIIAGDRFFYDGDPADISRIRNGRCIDCGKPAAGICNYN